MGVLDDNWQQQEQLKRLQALGVAPELLSEKYKDYLPQQGDFPGPMPKSPDLVERLLGMGLTPPPAAPEPEAKPNEFVDPKTGEYFTNDSIQEMMRWAAKRQARPDRPPNEVFSDSFGVQAMHPARGESGQLPGGMTAALGQHAATAGVGQPLPPELPGPSGPPSREETMNPVDMADMLSPTLGSAAQLANPPRQSLGEIYDEQVRAGEGRTDEFYAKWETQKRVEYYDQQEKLYGPNPNRPSDEDIYTDELGKQLTKRDQMRSYRESQGMGAGQVLMGQGPTSAGGEYVMPPGQPGEAFKQEKAANDARLKVAADRGFAAKVAEEARAANEGKETEDPPIETGKKPEAGYANIEKPGDLRRAAAQKKLGQLTAMRDIAEGLGKIGQVAVTGDFSGTGPPREAMRQPFQAEGIRDMIQRTTDDENLFLKSQLRTEEMGELFKQRAGEERLKARLENIGIGSAMLTQDQMKWTLEERDRWLKSATNTKGQEALQAVQTARSLLKSGAVGGIAQQALARAVLKAYGEGSRMSDQDRETIINDPIFAGMADKIHRFFTGQALPSTMDQYRDIITKLDVATKRWLKQKRASRAKDFSSFTGVPAEVVLKAFGGDMDDPAQEGSDMVQVTFPSGRRGTFPRSAVAGIKQEYPDATIR